MILTNHSFSMSCKKPDDTAYKTNINIAPTKETILFLKMMAKAYNNTPEIMVLGIPKVSSPIKWPDHITSPYLSG